MKAPLPWDEYLRLKELWSYNILDSAQEKNFDELANLAAQVCACPMASITFVDRERQWFKAAKGHDIKETSRDIAFCAHTIIAEEALVVEDALTDSRFADNPQVTGDRHIRFYAGTPIYSANGFKLGSVCVLDDQPRTITPAQLAALRLISGQITNLLELKLKNQKLQQEAEALLSEQAKKLKSHTTYLHNGLLPQLIVAEDTLQVLQVNEAARQTFGYTQTEEPPLTLMQLLPAAAITDIKAITATTCHDAKPFKKSVTFLTRKGEQRPVHITGASVFFGDRIGLLITADTDKTEDSTEASAPNEPPFNNEAHQKVQELIQQELQHTVHQALTNTRLFLDLAQTSEGVKEELIELGRSHITQTISDINNFFTLLAAPPAKGTGLTTAAEALIATYARKEPFDVFFIYRGAIEKLPLPVKLALFRTIQSQLKNIAQHANASRVWINIVYEKGVELNIKDDGQGYAVHTLKEGTGFQRMKEYVKKYNGTLDVVTDQGKGCYIRLVLPVS